MATGLFADEFCIKPVKIDKHGALYKGSDITELQIKMITTECFFERRAKKMATDIDKAIERTEQSIEHFERTSDRLLLIEKLFAEQAKKTSGNVRDAGEKLGQSIIRIEKLADFNKLERYVDLLERAASAMNVLAELEKTGKLEKIASAIR